MDVIRITLRSDLCAGNGESRGNAVDIDIVLTADGLPRIPARRLKGCLRAAAEELAALGDETAAYTAELFGDKAGRQGYSKRGGKGCGRDLLGHVSGKGFPETGSLFLVFGMIDQNAFTAAVSAARALRYQPR